MKKFLVSISIVGALTFASVAPAAAKAPKACKKAFLAAEEVISLAGEGLAASARALEAAGNFDVDGINAETDILNGLTSQVDVAIPKYKRYKSLCLSG